MFAARHLLEFRGLQFLGGLLGSYVGRAAGGLLLAAAWGAAN